MAPPQAAPTRPPSTDVTGLHGLWPHNRRATGQRRIRRTEGQPAVVHRKRSEKSEADTLERSRRRCCVCFGLHNDLSVKRGQIAHLDGDPSNTVPENLAFLCLDHHDEYDSKTSQSKSLQLAEVKRYRSELYSHLDTHSELGVADTGAAQPNWDRLSVRQRNAVLMEMPHKCTHCGYSFFVMPRLEPGKNVYVKAATCPNCGNADVVSRFYEA